MSRSIPCAAILALMLLEASAGATDSVSARRLTSTDGSFQALTVIIPFYEGVELPAAPLAVARTPTRSLTLAYPGALSAPFVAWRFGDADWTVLRVDALGTKPAELTLRAQSDAFEVTLRSFTGARVIEESVRGDVPALAQALRRQWRVRGSGRTLRERYRGVQFYVHEYVSAGKGPEIRRNWDIPALVERMKGESVEDIQFVYGFDPSGADLAGTYFWTPAAEAKVKAVVGANRRLSHLSWLNLRTWKQAIPELDIQRNVDASVRAQARVFPPGMDDGHAADRFRSIPMCPASRGWQRSRLAQLDRLADLGFKVIQLDEFPIPQRWETVPCQSDQHLHRPNDIVDEWKQIDIFLQELSTRARRRNILLTCEEPSAALLPYVAGYIDRQFNDSIELYRVFRKMGGHPIPLFSQIFGGLATPYTDADERDPVREPPPGWLKQHKHYPPGS